MIIRDDLDVMLKKAKTKKDGVYSYRGHYYAVKDNTVHFVSSYTSVFERFGAFLCNIGKCEYVSDVPKRMKKLLKGN